MQRANQYFRPECVDVGKAFMISGGIEIAIITVVFIMLIFVASYNNMYNPTTTEDIAKKDKYINGLVITSTVLSAILLVIGVWHVFTSSKAKKCIENKPQ